MQEFTFTRFINYAISVAPARHHRAFRDDIENWLSTLSAEEMNKLALRLRSGAKRHSLAIARQMYDLFEKKGAKIGQVGS